MLVWYMYANIINGRELNIPNAEMLKFLKATSKLCPKSFVTERSKRQIKTIARTIYILMIKLKNEEKRRAERVLARLTGKTSTN